MSSMQIQQVLAEMRCAAGARGSGENASRSVSGTAQPSDFANLLKNSVDHIATMQNQATSIALPTRPATRASTSPK
jgi:flagellar hook-basal body complex protein FliE